MSNKSLKLSLSVVAFLAAASGAMAQTATGATTGTTSSGSMQAMPRDSGPSTGGSRSPMAGSDLSNSTRSLESGTASGKGSGPGAGSPNGGN